MSGELQIIPFDIGRPVIYRAAGGDKVELGWVFGLPPAGVFVVFPPSHQPMLTARENLTFVESRLAGDGTKQERARAYCAEVLAGTTLDPARHAEVIEELWHRFQPLVAQENPGANPTPEMANQANDQ